MSTVLVDGIAIDYSGLPDFCRETVRRYIERGCHPGSGWHAILSGDLRAVYMCDEETVAVLPQIAKWLHNHAPSQCHGSRENVLHWMLERAEERRKEVA